MKDGATLPLLLKELKLPTMRKLWEEQAKNALQEGWSPPKYLTRLCEYESAERESRRLGRHLQESCLPRGKGLEGFDFSRTEGLNKSQIMGLGRGELWIKEAMNVLLFGPSGVGKSHLACGIGKELVANGYRVLFAKATGLLERLEKAKREKGLAGALAKLDRYDCLILDDFGYVKRTEVESDVLFALICERYERKSILITCNQPFQEWDEIFENKRMAIAAVDRLIHHATIIEITGESYRRKEAEQRM